MRMPKKSTYTASLTIAPFLSGKMIALSSKWNIFYSGKSKMD